MKNILFFLCAAFLFSCSSEESGKPDPFYEYMDGRYTLKEMYTDTPIDLDFDGVYQTDMRQEMYCQMYGSINFYEADFEYNEWYGSLRIVFSIANSEVFSESPPVQCFNNGSLSYSGLSLDKETGEITITYRDEAREAEYGALTHAHYENRKIYLDVDKVIFTSEGWQTIPMHFVYEWENP